MSNEPRNPLIPTYTLQDIAGLAGVSYRKLRMDVASGAIPEPAKDPQTGRVDADSAWEMIKAIRALKKTKGPRGT